MTKTNTSKTKSILMLSKANQIFKEIKCSTKPKCVDHFVLTHKARTKNFEDVTCFILKTKDKVSAADYLAGLVMNNFASVNKLVNLLEDDGAVRTENDTWGVLDLNDLNNLDVKSLFNSLISTLNVSKNNPNKLSPTEGANLGVLSLSFEKASSDDIVIHAIQRTTDVGKKVIDRSKKSLLRKGNEAYIVSDERYKINPNYDFFVISEGSQQYLFVNNFSHFEYTADYDEVQNNNVKMSFQDLVTEKFISQDVKNKFENHIQSMGIREKNHFIRAINKGQYKSWTNLKSQQDIANKKLPASSQWQMKFNDKDELIYDGTKECVTEFFKFLSHTVVQSVSDTNVIIDISNWTPSSN